jgi:glutamate N-acetyltransferase / amino-acid N-acetyltransferase
VYGADPNWGRVIMAIGKCSEETDIVPEQVRVAFGDLEVYPRPLEQDGFEKLAEIMRSDIVHIDVALGAGDAAATVWGCDLSTEYVHINADYTT